MSEYHNPVLLRESLSALITDPRGCYADATFGGGGHSRGILGQLAPEGRLLAFDRDADAAVNAQLGEGSEIVVIDAPGKLLFWDRAGGLAHDWTAE